MMIGSRTIALAVAKRATSVCALVAVLCGVTVVPRVAAAADTIDFPIYSRTIFFLPVWIADKEGFLKDEGITIAFRDGVTQDQVAAGLKSGRSA